MSQTDPADSMAEDESPPPTVWQQLWRRYSPHGEFPLSSAAAIALHAFVILLLALGLSWLDSKTNKPPRIGPQVEIGEGGEGGGSGAGEGGVGGETGDTETAMESRGETSASETPVESTGIALVEKSISTSTDSIVEADDQLELQQQTKAEISKAANSAKLVKEKLAERMKEINKRTAKGKGSGSGSGDGGGTGDGSGEGGGAGGQRQSRWTLWFSRLSPQNYLTQIRALGAAVAVPADRGGYTFFDLSSFPPKATRQDLSRDSQMWWYDETPGRVSDVGRYLGIGRVEMLVLFLPLGLEERMLKMELNENNRREQDIISTEFEVYFNGSNYDVRVKKQRVR